MSRHDPWDYFSDCTRAARATDEAIRTLREQAGFPLPAAYLRMLSASNGGSGWVGENYVIMWSADEVLEGGRYPDTPQFLYFGSDGGGEGFAFRVQEGITQIVNVPFIGASDETARVLGDSIEDFLQRLRDRPLFD